MEGGGDGGSKVDVLGGGGGGEPGGRHVWLVGGGAAWATFPSMTWVNMRERGRGSEGEEGRRLTEAFREREGRRRETATLFCLGDRWWRSTQVWEERADELLIHSVGHGHSNRLHLCLREAAVEESGGGLYFLLNSGVVTNRLAPFCIPIGVPQ